MLFSIMICNFLNPVQKYYKNCIYASFYMFLFACFKKKLYLCGRKGLFVLYNIFMKKLLILVSCLWLTTTMNAQFFNRLLDSAKKSAEDAVEKQVQQKVEKGIDKAFNPEFPEKEQQEQQEQAEPIQPKQEVKAAAPAPKALESTYAKSDFVPGDEIMFEDDLVGEQMGEFPSKWDLMSGNAEIASVDGKTVINLTDVSTEIMPLMKDPKNYLTEAFTLEFDFLGGSDEKQIFTAYLIHLKNIEGEDVATITIDGTASGQIYTWWMTPNGDQREQNAAAPAKEEEWNHVALSFNKRALKVYLNGIRLVNIPNCARPQNFSIQRSHWADHRNLMTNIRLCKGAVPLYNRLMTDGKIITYAITFDIGKANIKPESMTEINRIAQLMKDNGDLKFEVQGHTDNTGTVAGNQKLSEQRAQAIVNKLVEMGIAANRLSAKGMGQSAPLADNSTDEGRAKNRRVEFIKK